MATVNRYTQTQNTTYEPRTLQELMLVPAYKRKQHDELNAGIAEYETELAQKKALGIHDDLLSEKQNELYQNMIKQRNALESEGFSQSSKSNFIRFNKQYQQAIGPQGDIGRIGAAEEAYAANKATSIENLITNGGYSPEEAKIAWETHGKQYEESFDGQNIYSIDQLYGPKNADVVDEVNKRIQLLGANTSDLGRITDNIVELQDGSGRYVLKEGWEEGSSSNTDALTGLENWVTSQINNPNSEIMKAYDFKGKTKKDALNELKGYTKMFEKTSFKRRDSEEITNLQYAPKSEEKPVSPGSNLYSSRREINLTEFASSDYKTNGDLVTKLRETSVDSPEYHKNIEKARQIEYNMEVVDFNLALEEGPGSYSDLLQQKSNFIDTIASLGDLPDSTIKGLESGKFVISQNSDDSMVIRTDQGYPVGNLITTPESLAEDLKTYKGIDKKVNEKRAQEIENQKIEYFGYRMPSLVMSDAKWKQQSADVRAEIAGDLINGNNYTLDSYQIGDLNSGTTNLSTDQRKQIGIALNNADKGEIRYERVYPSTESGIPALELSFVLKDDFNADVNDSGWNSKAKEGERVTVRIGLPNFDGTSGNISAVSNLFVKPYEEFGGKEGHYLAESLRYAARYKHIKYSGNPSNFDQSNQILNAAPFLKDVLPENSKAVNMYRSPDRANPNPFTFKIKDERGEGTRDLMWKDIITKDILDDAKTQEKIPQRMVDHFNRAFFELNEDQITKSDVQKMSNEQIDSYLEKFLKNYSDAPVSFPSKESAIRAFIK